MKISLIATLFILLILSACNKLPDELRKKVSDEVQVSLDAAGKNRAELERVLIHYAKTNKDSLKFKAACFLIENMNGHYSLAGDNANKFEKLYKVISRVSVAECNELYKQTLDSLNIGAKFRKELDLEHISSKFLINHIDHAFKIWEATPWYNRYSFDVFCEYVLPYRVSDEKLTLWRPAIEKKFKDLLDKIYFEVGSVYEAENATLTNAPKVDLPSASNYQIVSLASKGKISFENIHSEPGEKVLQFKYINGGKDSKVQIVINNTDTVSVILRYTGGWSKLNYILVKVPIYLNKGINDISLLSKTGKVSIDCIELVPVMSYSAIKKSGIVPGATYKITNYQTNLSLTIETDPTKNISFPEVSEYVSHNSQKFIISYSDYGFYTIRPFNLLKQRAVLNMDKCQNEFGGELVTHTELNQFNEQWTIVPFKKTGLFKIVNRGSGKSLQQNSRLSNNRFKVVQSEFNSGDNQLWQLEMIGEPPVNDSLSGLKMGTAIEASFRTYQETLNFEWFLLKGAMPSVNAIDLMEAKIGNCREETHYLTYLSRGLGIPITIDFIPQWPFRSLGHAWNVLLDENGKIVRYQSRCKPGTQVYDWGCSKAKVFRHTFSINHQSLAEVNYKKEDIPPLFQSNHFIDVTDEYSETSTLSTMLNPKSAKGRNFAYLSIFNNRDWTPIYWGKIQGNKVLFKKMGRNVAYLPVYYDLSGITPAGSPFLLTHDGKIKQLIPNKKKLQRMVLYRKHPYLIIQPKDTWVNDRLLGAKFQGANNANFLNAVDLFTFNSITDGRFYNIKIKDNRTYKYLRLIGADGKHCDVSEISFYDEKGTELNGKIIGSPGSFEDNGSTKEKAFDKDILTVFESPQANGAWVGLKLDKAAKVGKIRFMPRTDGNIIEPGDTYELVYWNNGWKSQGVKRAVNDSIVFDNVPSGALYLLHDLTKGVEERIFTYEKGKQVWW